MKIAASLVLVVLVSLSGCSDSHPAAKPNTQAGTAVSTLPDSFKLSAEPSGAVVASQVRATAKTGDNVVIVGRVGRYSVVDPFADGFASFTIVDQKMKPCGEDGMDGCKTPWDYCCADADEMKASTVNIEFRDAKGKPHSTSARGFHGIVPLATVVVTGKAEKDEAGNLIIAATGVFVRP